MNPKPFRVDGMDHVELFVSDPYEAAKWYERVLGLTIVREHEDWAAGGPLMISSDGGKTMLALFRGTPPGDRPAAGFRRVAFRVDAEGFLCFLDRLDEYPLYDLRGERVTRDQLVDHQRSWSIYFNDPYGHHYEITTYDHAKLFETLNLVNG